MPKSVQNQVEDTTIKEYYHEHIIFTNRNRIILEFYKDGVNTHDITAVLDNNYNNYNSNDIDYEDVDNNEEESASYKYDNGANTTQ